MVSFDFLLEGSFAMLHYESAVVALKPFIIAVGISALAMGEKLFAQADVSQTFEAIGVYGLPTVLVVYFIARDWYRESVAEANKKSHEAQAIKDKEELSKLTEADKARSHEARRDRDREQTQTIAAERAKNHELQMALIDLLRNGHIDMDRAQKLTDSSTGKFIQR